MRAFHKLRARMAGRLDETGQALVEFAFVLVMMLILVVGLIDFARLFLQYQVMTDAAREAARSLVVENGVSSNTVRDRMLSSLALGGITTTGYAETVSCDAPSGSVSVVTIYRCRWDNPPNPAPPPGEANYPVRVGLAVPFDFALVGPFLGWATGDRTITLRTTFFMRKE